MPASSTQTCRRDERHLAQLPSWIKLIHERSHPLFLACSCSAGVTPARIIPLRHSSPPPSIHLPFIHLPMKVVPRRRPSSPPGGSLEAGVGVRQAGNASESGLGRRRRNRSRSGGLDRCGAVRCCACFLCLTSTPCDFTALSMVPLWLPLHAPVPIASASTRVCTWHKWCGVRALCISHVRVLSVRGQGVKIPKSTE